MRATFFTTMLVLGVTAGALDAQQKIAAAPQQAPSLAARTATRFDARSFTATIQGNALTSTEGQLANATVRLRDARWGRIIDSVLTDESGLFTFPTVDPGSYVVEIIGDDHTSILATSRIVNVDAGDVVSVVVKLPLRTRPFGALLTGSSAATAIIAAAAANAVLAVAAPAGAVTTCATQLP